MPQKYLVPLLNGHTTQPGQVITSKELGGASWETLNLVAALVGGIYNSKTVTNIGSVYTAIYGGALGPEKMFKIDFSGAIYFRLVYLWNYAGTGTQTLQWVDQSDPSKVLWTSPNITSDCDPGDSGWIPIPSDFQAALKILEWRAKSTQATDDPIAKGYAIYLR